MKRAAVSSILWVVVSLGVFGAGPAAKTKKKAPPPPKKAAYDFLTRTGTVYVERRTTPSQVCFKLPLRDVPAGTKVTVVNSGPPPAIQLAEVTGVCEELELEPARVNGAPVRSLALKLLDTTTEAGFGIGVVGRPKLTVGTNGMITGDLDGDRTMETFAECNSTEGLHFTIWSGEARKGTRRWHQYHYLGVDMDPACTNEETAQ